MSPENPEGIAARLNRGMRSASAKVTFVSRVRFGERLELSRYRLGNGLGILLLPDRSAPVVSYHTWFNVGSRHDRPGKTGLAHLFEHLMFNETRTLPAGSYDRLLEAAGGETNAATWVDWTCYYVNLPSSELELAVRLESDRMANLVLDGPKVEVEKEVVANERRFRVEDSVEGAMNELLYATSFKRHPYGQPTIGWMKDIEGFTAGDCRSFYRTYYAPNNATLAVAGYMDEEEALGLIQRYYGSIKRQKIPVSGAAAERRQRAERRLTLHRPATSERFLLGYRAPEFGDPTHAHLTVASEILFGGRSSRLYRRLVRKSELAVEAQGSVSPFQQPGLYEILVVLRQGRDWRRAFEVVQKEIDRLRARPVGKRELKKVKNRIDLSFLQSLETAAGKAERIAFYHTVLGDAGQLFRKREAYLNTSADDVMRAASRFLDSRYRTSVIVIPENRGSS
jgi:zinc protease